MGVVPTASITGPNATLKPFGNGTSAQKISTLPQLTTHDQLSYSYDPDGTPLTSDLSPLTSYPLTDLALTAALVPLGFPVLSIDGPHGAHRYQVPALGLPIRDSAGVLTRYHAARLTQSSAGSASMIPPLVGDHCSKMAHR